MKGFGLLPARLPACLGLRLHQYRLWAFGNEGLNLKAFGGDED